MKRLVPSIETILLIVASLGLVAFFAPPSSQDRPPSLSPTRHELRGAPPQWDDNLMLPARSPRTSNYTMNVKLDTDNGLISGTAVLEWVNTTGSPQSTFPFHLYHNAWKNNRSTFATEMGWELGRPSMSIDDYGYTHVRSIEWLRDKESLDIMRTFRYIQPDDGNPDDQTVFEVSTPAPVRPGETMRLRMTFETKQPIPISRTGHIRTYHFVAQWFPKIGVFWNGEWNCHQFHANTEFFADYGVYDVAITLPTSYKIGATGGIARMVTENDDGTTTHRFVQEDVHDFAWVASPDIVVSRRTFSHSAPEPGEALDRHRPLTDVEVIVLTQPQHDGAIDRYFDATFKALRYFGEWYGAYPYTTVTVVDPANDSRSGGMEYPTLFTGGSNMFTPRSVPSPESVTVHEFGHQFWYGLVGSNEFEEAWLDEGFNTYSQDRVLMHGWSSMPFNFESGPWRSSRFYFGGPGAGTFVGIPYVWDEMPTLRLLTGNLQLREQGKNDPMAKRGWEYLDSYGLNSYTKPALTLHTLERYLGEETMYRVMRTYHHRYRFGHPTSSDFIATVNEVAGKDMTWYFDQTWYSSDLFDYEVSSISNIPIPPPGGAFNANGGDSLELPPVRSRYYSKIVVKRLGEAKAPVDILVRFKDGSSRIHDWDGQERWTTIEYKGDVPVVEAIVDPYRKLLLDVNWVNNSKVVRSTPSLASRKWGARFLFWVQSYLDMVAL